MRFAEASLQIVTSAYASVPDARPERSLRLTQQRLRIRAYIEQHLRDPDLTPQSIAEELHITRGYMHRLFPGDSESPARYILRRRLEEAHRALSDSMQAERSITHIAFDQGSTASRTSAACFALTTASRLATCNGAPRRRGSRAPPKCLARDSGALRQGPELRPRDLRMAAQAQPAIGRRDDPLPPDDVREPLDSLGDEVGMLDQRGRVTDDAGREDLVIRQFDRLPHDVLVLVPDVRAPRTK